MLDPFRPDSRNSANGGAALYVGVDGGGSTCRVRVRSHDGRIVGEAVAGAANVYLDFDAAMTTLRATLAAALAPVSAETASLPSIALGLAGVSSPVIADRVRVALDSMAATVIVTSDADIACVGAHAGRDGGLIVAGTGSGAVARLDGRKIALGGRGFILGDDGSGARLGLEAMRVALRAHDGLHPHTPLTRALMARFDHDPVAAIAWGRSARSSDYAALAPEVIAAASRHDAAAGPLVIHAVEALAQLAEALHRHGVPRLAFVGGLAPALAPFLPPSFKTVLSPPLHDALDGALLLAGCPALSAAP